jgi:thymidylate synthase ThyX
MIQAKIIKDSINRLDTRLTTWELTYPRFIHSEIMTHRTLSKNSASSRAIPVSKMIKNIEDNPAMPERWGKTGKGMQDHGELDMGSTRVCQELWLSARDQMISVTQKLLDQKLHKQVANRILEPFSHMTIICSGTEWENFFSLRAHPDAQPEFQILAYKMLDLYNESIPDNLGWGDWHIPYYTDLLEDLSIEDKLKVATARCARVSYLNFDGKIEIAKDIELHDMLLESGHFSPFEHCAQTVWFPDLFNSSNFGPGYAQYRKTLGVSETRKDDRVIKKKFILPS